LSNYKLIYTKKENNMYKPSIKIKTLSILEYLINMIVSGFFAVTALVIYPLAYLLRKQLRWMYHESNNMLLRFIALPLWIYLNDGKSNDLGYEWFFIAKNLYPTTPWNRFKLSYMWSAQRNPAWNHYQIFKPRVGDAQLIHQVGEVTRPNTVSKWYHSANLKYVNSKGEFSDNKGEYLSIRFSFLGEQMVWFKVDDRVYFSYSLAKKIRGYWIEIMLGANEKRFKLRFKIKNVEVYEEVFN
jgi:hypothetical protein